MYNLQRKGGGREGVELKFLVWLVAHMAKYVRTLAPLINLITNAFKLLQSIFIDANS